MSRKVKKYLFNQYIKLSKMRSTYNAIEAYSKMDVLEQVSKLNLKQNFIAEQLSELIKPKHKHYKFGLAHKFLIGRIYRLYYKIFNGFKWGHGPITIIGKVGKEGNCEYPNTPYYRITKAWRYL